MRIELLLGMTDESFHEKSMSGSEAVGSGKRAMHGGPLDAAGTAWDSSLKGAERVGEKVRESIVTRD